LTFEQLIYIMSTITIRMKQRQLIKQLKYLTAKDPEQRVAHIPPIVAPGPECQHNAKKMLISIAKMDQQIVAKTET